MGKFFQVKTAVACSLGNAINGILFVWPSYTLHHYTNQNTTVISAPMNDIESSLVGSLPSLGAMAGSLMIGMVINTFGRRNGSILNMLLITISWLMIDLTGSTIAILIARFISGIAAGGVLIHSPIFISEIAEESIRGMLTSVPMFLHSTGLMTSYIFGWFLSYRQILWINIAITVAYIALMMTVRESPLFLMRKNREEEAALSIAHYRGVSASSKIVLEEVSRIKQAITPAKEILSTDADDVEKVKLNPDNQTAPPPKLPIYKLLLTSGSSRRAFMVVGFALTVHVMMGTIAVQVYAKEIFIKAAPSMSPHLCSVMLAAALLVGSFSSTVFIDKYGRRILMTSSSVLVTMCLVALGVLLQTELLPAWVTAILMLVFCLTFMLGAGTIPFVLLAESFIPEVQGLASTILMEWLWFLNFVLTAIFPFIAKSLGIYGSFYCFAFFGVISACIGLFLVPETKGLTNEQIQEAYLRQRMCC